MKPAASRFAFAALCLTTVGVAALYGFNIVRWGGLPEYGYFMRSATGADVIGGITETGRRAGLQPGDRILTVNGRSFSSMKELRAAVNKGPGDRNTYLIARGNRKFEVAVENVPRGFRRAVVQSGLPYLVGLCYAGIGILVFLMKPHRRVSWVFVLFGTLFGMLLFFIFKASRLEPDWFASVNILLYCLAPAAILHLAMTFPEERRLIRDHPQVQVCPYLASATLFAAIRRTAPDMFGVPKPWVICLALYLTGAFLVLVISTVHLRLKSTSAMTRTRSRLTLLGVVITASLPLADTLATAIGGVYLVPDYGYYLPFLIVFPACVGYAIIKHNLFDIDAVIRRTFGYVLVTGILAAAYTVFIFLPAFAFRDMRFFGSPVFPIIVMALVFFVLNMMRSRLQRLIDRVFYRLEYDYQETIENISETMRSLMSVDRIGEAVMSVLQQVLFARHPAVWLADREGRFARIAAAADSPDAALPEELPAELARRKKIVSRDEIAEDPTVGSRREKLLNGFDGLAVELVVPMIYEDRLIGLMALGRKKSGKFYRHTDIGLLKTLANQAAVAFSNAWLHQARIEALEHSQRELARLSEAKSKALDHLSHEMVTPLSLLRANFKRLQSKIQDTGAAAEGAKIVDASRRQLERLRDIQTETEKIIRAYRELDQISAGERSERDALFTDLPLAVRPFTEKVLGEVRRQAMFRRVAIDLDGDPDLKLPLNPAIVADLIRSLVKNAIENTPDEGSIRVGWQTQNGLFTLTVEDFGVGITPDNQRYIFSGLFPTQSIDAYSSKRPFEFNAGGKGLDLYRLKVYSIRYGYDLAVESQRCRRLESAAAVCPGRISECADSGGVPGCRSSGGTRFQVRFPSPPVD